MPVITAKNSTGVYSVKVIDEAGNSTIIKLTQEEGFTARRVSKQPTEYYGKEITNYTCTNSEGVNLWKIFYADNNNIYIIADNYIHYNYCPPSATQTICIDNSTSSSTDRDRNYCLSMRNVIEDYSGSSDIIDRKIKALNNDYFSKGYTSIDNNMKVVAYMLDTNVWSVFAGDKAEFAIGGPTVEMFMKSYSQKYNVDYRAKAFSSIGYRISNDGGSTWTPQYYPDMLQGDRLYILKGGSSYMWLASPANRDGRKHVMVAGAGSRTVLGTDYDGYSGFRPLVCLKSDVELEENADRTYSIK